MPALKVAGTHDLLVHDPTCCCHSCCAAGAPAACLLTGKPVRLAHLPRVALARAKHRCPCWCHCQSRGWLKAGKPRLGHQWAHTA